MPGHETARATDSFHARRLWDALSLGPWPNEHTTPMERIVHTGTTAPTRVAELPPIVMGGIDGLLREFVNHATETAKSPQPFLALGAAICAIGAAAGRRFRSETNLRSNTMILALADSAGGKECPRSLIGDLFVAAEMDGYLGGSKVASSGGLLTALENHPVRLFAFDEVGHVFGLANRKNAGSYQAEILPLLTELWSKAGTFYSGTNFSDAKARPQVKLIQPCVVIYGVTVARVLWEGFGTGALSDGSLARFLIFETPTNYPDTAMPVSLPVPDTLIAGIRRIAGRDGDLGAATPAMIATEPPRDVYTIRADTEAAELLRAVDQEELARKRMHEGTHETAFWGRFNEHVIRLAMISALSRDQGEPMIVAHDVKWSTALVRYTATLGKSEKAPCESVPPRF